MSTWTPQRQVPGTLRARYARQMEPQSQERTAGSLQSGEVLARTGWADQYVFGPSVHELTSLKGHEALKTPAEGWWDTSRQQEPSDALGSSGWRQFLPG